MTQELLNTVNNLQELMTQGQQKIQSVKAEFSATDKKSSVDFEKIYNKQLNIDSK